MVKELNAKSEPPIPRFLERDRDGVDRPQTFDPGPETFAPPHRRETHLTKVAEAVSDIMTLTQLIAGDTGKLPWMDMKQYATDVIEEYEGDPKPDVIKLGDALAKWASRVKLPGL